MRLPAFPLFSCPILARLAAAPIAGQRSARTATKANPAWLACFGELAAVAADVAARAGVSPAAANRVEFHRVVRGSTAPPRSPD